MATLSQSRVISIGIIGFALFLGVIHVLLGSIALSPALGLDYHRELKLTYQAFSKTLTFLHGYVDRVTLASVLRIFVASLQIGTGSTMLLTTFAPLKYIQAANYLLILTNLFYLLIQFRVGSAFDRIAPTIIFAILSTARLLIVRQTIKKSVKPTKGKAKLKSSTPKKSKAE